MDGCQYLYEKLLHSTFIGNKVCTPHNLITGQLLNTWHWDLHHDVYFFNTLHLLLPIELSAKWQWQWFSIYCPQWKSTESLPSRTTQDIKSSDPLPIISMKNSTIVITMGWTSSSSHFWSELLNTGVTTTTTGLFILHKIQVSQCQGKTLIKNDGMVSIEKSRAF